MPAALDKINRILLGLSIHLDHRRLKRFHELDIHISQVKADTQDQSTNQPAGQIILCILLILSKNHIIPPQCKTPPYCARFLSRHAAESPYNQTRQHTPIQ